jgi:hypothetical protein
MHPHQRPPSVPNMQPIQQHVARVINGLSHRGQLNSMDNMDIRHVHEVPSIVLFFSLSVCFIFLLFFPSISIEFCLLHLYSLHSDERKVRAVIGGDEGTSSGSTVSSAARLCQSVTSFEDVNHAHLFISIQSIQTYHDLLFTISYRRLFWVTLRSRIHMHR